MTQQQIEQAARDHRKQVTIWRGRKEAHYANRDFVAGANQRQPEIDILTARIAQLEADCEKYRKDIAEGLKREEIARRVIEEKRKSVKP